MAPVKNKIRVVTAASLFDGHDAAINIMRRILQSAGAEVIHLGHDRSVSDVVDCAIQEDAQAIAMTSYQGGHVEYFKYMVDLLKEKGASHIRVFGGGGGVILPSEIEELHRYGVARIYSPDDGRKLGLQGMIDDLLSQSDFVTGNKIPAAYQAKDARAQLEKRSPRGLAELISVAENSPELFATIRSQIEDWANESPSVVLGITGTGGAGKSSLVDEFIQRYLRDDKLQTVAVISVDPSKRKTGGALLGDRIRMNSAANARVYMRSMATRQANLAVSKHVSDALAILKAARFDLVILETAGIGQSDTEITEFSDLSLYVMTPEFGAATQLEKIDMIDFADCIAINKFDKRGAQDALRDVIKQYKRSRNQFQLPDEKVPVFGTIASQFNDPGMNRLYVQLISLLAAKAKEKNHSGFSTKIQVTREESRRKIIVPSDRSRYLSEISDAIRRYNRQVETDAKLADEREALLCARNRLSGRRDSKPVPAALEAINDELLAVERSLSRDSLDALKDYDALSEAYSKDEYEYSVRGKPIRVKTQVESLSHVKIPKVIFANYTGAGDRLRFMMQENVPGRFPYTAGVFPFKRAEEDPTRMFAGEGGPERTNRRFHYVSKGMPAKRLSTAFDSVTLYGQDPARRPDIYGKIGNSGVSVCSLDDAKKLYSGFDLCDPKTSVSMTINGPAPLMTAFFMNAAIDQQVEKYIKANGLAESVTKKIKTLVREQPRYAGELPEGNDGLGLMLLGVTGDQVIERSVYEKIKADTLKAVRGTVQADILKEDQAQNTCILSTEFSLKLMGDVQEYFIENQMKNFYSVSISGYHIAEAGANPVTQLAFTLANGFTYVEYYRSRNMNVNDFAPNLSFFFSNGVDPEYAVIGRVARRIWAKAMRALYGADSRSQMLKYHIQTSGRSLHAQEIDFNDIRTTLQAAYAIFDNCNSLHTNAYDEAITTPTEESVRRAIAIQLIINKELGMAKNENPLQGSFFIEKLTDLVEEAVLQEFDRLSERGGVLGAMETMYQRNQIQEESLYYEQLKHSGSLPVVGVNTFLSSKGSPTVIPSEVIRSTTEEKEAQIRMVESTHARNAERTKSALNALQQAALRGENVFAAMMESAKVCTLGQMTEALFEAGGRYRRSM